MTLIRGGRGRLTVWVAMAALVLGCTATTSPAPRSPAVSGPLASGIATAAAASNPPVPVEPSPTAPPPPTPRIGGTLHVGLPAPGDNGPITDLYLDPHRWFGTEELFRCCLARTLLSYNGRTTAEGGVILRPDLADSLPDVSSDGLTWTFRLQDGLHYAPPYADTPIVARDVIRGIERSIALGEGRIFFQPIKGAAAYADKAAATVAGLEAPDARTLIVRLEEPNADIATALSMPVSVPVPEGATAGHDEDYGRFFVASGPYMYDGSERLKKGGAGEGLGGGLPEGSGVLVRNPSWDRATDSLRAARVDRIEFSRSRDVADDRARVERGDVDLGAYTLSPAELATVRNDPARRDRVALVTFPGVYFLPFNLALPPFDDIHVRRAIAVSLDRAGLADTLSATNDRFSSFRVARHAIPDSFENNLLLDYDPFPTNGDKGDIAAGRAEMAQSRYDTDRDGRCDAPACKNIPLRVGATDPRILTAIQKTLTELGITLRARSDDADPYHVRSHNGVFVLPAWLSDTPALGGFISVFGKPIEEGTDPPFSLSASVIGASPDQLKEWGYKVESVPSLDAKVLECLAVVGSERFRCASELDQLVAERAAPFVPIAFPEAAFIYSRRVAAYSIDQAALAPALDQIAVSP